MEEITVKTIDIDGKDFILIETIDKYNFFVDEDNYENICILKEIIDDNKEYLVDVEDDEFDKALTLYYEKLKNTN